MALGSLLAGARHEAGLSVEDVALATRVRAAVIQGIERDDFRLCGGDVYARGHIRAIARYLGVPAEPLIAEFDRTHADEAVTVAQVFEAERLTGTERRRPNWTAAMAVGVVAVLAVAVVSVLGDRGTEDPGLALPTSTPTTSSTPASSAPEPATTGIEADASGVTVQMSFAGSSWIRVVGSAGTAYEGISRAGTTRTFNDPREISVVIGNAGAVRLVVNGEDLGVAGGSGQVVRATYGPAGD